MTAEQHPQTRAEEHIPGAADALETPEADSAEQRAEVDTDAGAGTEEWDGTALDRDDVPEADAVEQRRGVGGEDEYR